MLVLRRNIHQQHLITTVFNDIWVLCLLEWFEQAFGKERNKMLISFNWITEKPKDKRKDITISYFVRLKYTLYKEVSWFAHLD